MLYISRNLGTNQWAVKDTDDGVEERVNDLKLRHLVLELGLEIAGVEVSVMGKVGGRHPYWPGMTKDGRYISKVRVWQDDSKKTPHQKKSFVLKGIDIRTSGRVIKSVSWDVDRIAEGTKIRLSEFGTSCDGYILQGAPMLLRPVTIILDDKIRIKKHTFKNGFVRDLRIDMREVTDERTVRYVYEQAIHDRADSFPQSIIDSNERIEFWSVMDVVIRGMPQDFTWSDEVGFKVGAYWLEEFKALANSPLELNLDSTLEPHVKAHVSHIRADEAFWRSNCQDYKSVRYNDYDDVCSILAACMKFNWIKMSHFRNYMTYITPSEDVKKVYVFLCNRVNNWLLDLHYQKGLV